MTPLPDDAIDLLMRRTAPADVPGPYDRTPDGRDPAADAADAAPLSDQTPEHVVGADDATAGTGEAAAREGHAHGLRVKMDGGSPPAPMHLFINASDELEHQAVSTDFAVASLEVTTPSGTRYIYLDASGHVLGGQLYASAHDA